MAGPSKPSPVFVDLWEFRSAILTTLVTRDLCTTPVLFHVLIIILLLFCDLWHECYWFGAFIHKDIRCIKTMLATSILALVYGSESCLMLICFLLLGIVMEVVQKKEKYVFALHFDHRLFSPVLGLDYSRSPLLG